MIAVSYQFKIIFNLIIFFKNLILVTAMVMKMMTLTIPKTVMISTFQNQLHLMAVAMSTMAVALMIVP